MRKIIAILLLICSLASLAACAKKANADNSLEDKKKMEELFYKVCSADEALELAKNANIPVCADLGCTSGKDTWDAFFNSVTDGKAASVLVADYYTLDKDHVSPELYEQEKDKYPCLYFTLVEYDGKEFAIQTRLSSESEIERQETFKYLQHFTGKAPATALYSEYDYYVLVDEKAANWEEIERELFSSASPYFRKYCTVFENCT